MGLLTREVVDLVGQVLVVIELRGSERAAQGLKTHLQVSAVPVVKLVVGGASNQVGHFRGREELRAHGTAFVHDWVVMASP